MRGRMTWLEKFREDHPTLTDAEIMDDYCPVDGLVGMCPTFDGKVDCEKCWKRPADDDDITVAGPVYEPDPDAGLSETGPDRT